MNFFGKGNQYQAVKSSNTPANRRSIKETTYESRRKSDLSSYAQCSATAMQYKRLRRLFQAADYQL